MVWHIDCILYPLQDERIHAAVTNITAQTPEKRYNGDRMIPTYLLLLCLRVRVAALVAITDTQCELTERAVICLDRGDVGCADEIMRFLDEYDLDQD